MLPSNRWSVPFHVAIICCLPLATVEGYAPITVTTRTVIRDRSPEDVEAYLASPGNWPKIVSTSVGVSSEEDVTKPLRVGKTVDEIFGLPPVLPLRVRWTRTGSTILPSAGRFEGLSIGQSRPASPPPISRRLEFFSSDGLEGVADKCEMVFDIRARGTDTPRQETEIFLDMRYRPVSILAILAVPILIADNAVALNFLLPAAMRTSPELGRFRNLMGSLYLVAGSFHLADCLLGSSRLLLAAGAPSFDKLPLPGQIYTLLWCCTGPLSFALTRLGAGYADLGLILYGLVEVVGAGLVAAKYGTPISSGASALPAIPFGALVNAILVQAAVAGAWVYSAKASQNEDGGLSNSPE